MGIYINRIFIKNFKLFNSVAQPIELKSKNLTILDGPNGFGKTSIFDVIELILTGKLKRIKKSDARTKYKELLLQNDKSVESILKVEFVNELSENQFTIAKKIEANYRTEKNSPDDFEIFKTHLLSDFNEDLTPQNLITNDQIITEKFGVDLKSIFNLVYYIEQEDNKFFLRMNEGDRLNQISILFNTEDEQDEKKYYREVRNKVNSKRTQLTKRITQLETSIKELKVNFVKENENIEYFCLLPHLPEIEPWDIKDLSLSDNLQKEKYITELDNIKIFLNSYNDYKAEKENTVIKDFLENEDLITDFVVLKSKISNTKDLIERYNDQVEIYRISKDLEKPNFMLKWRQIDFKKLYNFQTNKDISLISEESYRYITNKINELIKLEKDSSQISNSLLDLVNIRDSFVEKYKQNHTLHPEIKEGQCPLCGADWKTFDKLVEVFETKKDFLQNLLDDVSNKIKANLEELYTKELVTIITNLQNYFVGNNGIIGSDNFKQISKSRNNSKKVDEFEKWFVKNNIEVDSILTKGDSYIEPKFLEKSKIQLIESLNSKYRKINQELTSDDMVLFNSIFRRYFLNDSNLVQDCRYELVNKKINFIKECYYNNVFKKKKKLQKEYDELLVAKSNYDKLFNDLTKLVNEYTDKIKGYWKKIMKDIEIVFYIYSGKILQNHQRGLGIFMKESESKIIRFITHPEKDHDISNFMSSGQLSAIILSLTLSLNKVYGNKGLSTLLIDDPLQTMDDINISSFLELLRNDFCDKQIILSTHEEDVTNYMLYKFSNFNLEAQSLNLKDKYYIENRS